MGVRAADGVQCVGTHDLVPVQTELLLDDGVRVRQVVGRRKGRRGRCDVTGPCRLRNARTRVQNREVRVPTLDLSEVTSTAMKQERTQVYYYM